MQNVDHTMYSQKTLRSKHLLWIFFQKWVSTWLIKFNSLSQMADIELQELHKSCSTQFWFKNVDQILHWCFTSLWCHNERNGVSNHQPHDCLPKKISKLCINGLSEGNSPVTSEFPAQRASNKENVSISWCHHVKICCMCLALEGILFWCTCTLPPH